MRTTTVTPPTDVAGTCAAIVELLLPHRRAADPDAPADPLSFPAQLHQLAEFVRGGEPVLFTLPAFPCKSPNPAKVFGQLPDLGELLSLRFLDELCRSVATVYAPGASLLICSDGHIFGDVIGVPDPHVDAYSDELRAMIERDGLDRLRTFDLRSVHPGLSYDDRRRVVSTRFAPSIASLREEVRAGGETLRLYRGITRFLVDDTADWSGTRSALQRRCRALAYEVIARSRAWGSLVAHHHRRSVRLSIHPQPAGAPKFGIRLLDAPDAWTTPWHSVLVLRDGRPTLMRRVDAEKQGEVVWADGRPSHVVAH